LAELIIAVANLVEAEGRALRRAVIRTKLGIESLWAVSIIFLGGLALCLWAVFQSIVLYWGSIAAALITGLVMLCLAGVLAWIIVRINL
jgi:ABC-type siderophore export system fused ATPase/permease subunit